MSINGISNSGSVPAMGSFANVDTLTGESLLIYCQSQLSNIDGDIKAYMNQQKLDIAKKSILSDLKNTLTTVNPPKTKADWEKVGDAYATASQKLKEVDAQYGVDPATDTSLSGLEQAASKCMSQYHQLEVLNSVMTVLGFEKGIQAATKDFDWHADKEPWQGIIGDAQNLVDDVSGNAEINMIQLQSLMSKRQTAVQLTTNMLSKLDQTTSSIVANMK